MKRALTFAILVTGCFFLATSDNSPANGLKRLRNRISDVSQHSPGHRKALRVKRLLYKLTDNNKDTLYSSSRIQYVRGLFGVASRTANLKMSVQKPKVSY